MDVGLGGLGFEAAEPSAGLSDELLWVAAILWPDADVRLSPPRVPPGHRIAEAFHVVPSIRRPALLVPASAPELAEEAIRSLDAGERRDRPLRRALAARIASTSVGWRRFPTLVVLLDRDPRPDELLVQRLRAVLDRPDALPVVVLPGGTRGPAPLVLACTMEGAELARVTLGWNELTRAFVRNEATALRRWARRPPATFDVPEVLDDAEWNGRAFLMTSPAPPTGERFVRKGVDLDVPAMREIAGVGGLALRPLASSPWWGSVAERLAPGPARVVLNWMADLHGRRLVPTGSWHGDCRSGNVVAAGERVVVTGWERSGDGVPLGLDAVHLRFEESLARGPGRVSRAGRHAVQRSRDSLRGLGVPAEDEPLLMACYLMERLARLHEGADGSHVEGSPRYEAELLADVRAWVARS
jgi:hypothetical protein